MIEPLRLSPEYRDYVWGGDKLRPGISPTAEAWVVYEKDLAASGVFAGRSLADLALEFGPRLLGERVTRLTGSRFPLLVKILDCAQWLSVQVHPNDEQAQRLEGEGYFGKTEAWHVLEAEPGAELIAGMQPGVTAESLRQSIIDGTVTSLSQYQGVQPGQTIFIRPGTIHALGPGLLIYEVQQTSDLTYRVFDWGRPQTEKRKLHIEKSLEVTDPLASARAIPYPKLADGGQQLLTQCEYFSLSLMEAENNPIQLNTAGQTFHAVTVIEGSARVKTDSGSVDLNRFETVLIPAECGAYEIQPLGAFRALRSSVE
ncbi:MAG: type I phosphomannose isomerase catalytic subunit [Chloroflexota bacterium]